MIKWIFRIAVGLVALLVIALIVVFFSLNTIVKKGVETAGPMLTKVEVRLGGANLSPLSGSGQLSELFVGNPEGYKTPSAITMKSIKVGVKPSSLLSDTIVVEEVNIQGPEITFEGSLGGNNLSKIMDNLDAAAGGDKTETPAKTEKPAKKSEKNFYVKELLLQGGKIHVSITGLGAKEMTVPLPDVHLQNIGTADKGVTAAELSKQIMKQLLASVTKAVGEALSGIGKGVKDVGKQGTEQLEKTTKGIKDLFKK
jgi:hypothetical protein